MASFMGNCMKSSKRQILQKTSPPLAPSSWNRPWHPLVKDGERGRGIIFKCKTADAVYHCISTRTITNPSLTTSIWPWLHDSESTTTQFTVASLTLFRDIPGPDKRMKTVKLSVGDYTVYISVFMPIWPYKREMKNSSPIFFFLMAFFPFLNSYAATYGLPNQYFESLLQMNFLKSTCAQYR